MPRILHITRTLLIGRASARISLLVTLMQEARRRRYSLLARWCASRLERYGNYISPHAKIGRRLKLPHPTSIVIGEGVIIGDDVTIYQNVTLGGRVLGDWKKGNYPEIAENTVIFAGAVIVGKVRIGRNCVVGANSVVTANIPDNATAVGAPARIIKIKAEAQKET
ncbi:serine O-acetyltransferase [Pseudotabrizicola alkalilacus]|nr:serine acetyltransferase [Pseudotabrizicola alkalilacus]